MTTFVTNHKQPYDALQKVISSLPLKGKSALVTGAGRGVGEHIARSLAEAGAARIGLLGREKSRIDGAQEKFTKAFPATQFSAFAADITDEVAITSVFQSFGAPDILVNNAGVFPDEGSFVRSNLTNWFSGFHVNVFGTANVTQKFLQAKSPQKSAIVLNVTSRAAHMRFPLVGWSGYSGSKMGQARIFENIRFEHPEVHFVNVHPGMIDSDGFVRSGAPIPPGGMTSGDLVGKFFAWLATPDADFLSGRFLWAEWDIEELKAKEKSILDNDLLLTTIDGLYKGVF